MTLFDFQRALADCVANGALRDAITRAPDMPLADYSLTLRERERLTAALAHRGMPVTVGLYRANRLTVIHGSLPLTCALLGMELRAVVDAFWANSAPSDLQHATEAARFARFLRARLADRTLDVEWLRDVLSFEMSALELTLPQRPEVADAPFPRLHPRVRLVRFGTEPKALLARVWAGEPTGDLGLAEHWLLLDGRGETVEARDLTRPAGRALSRVKLGKPAPRRLVDTLSGMGLVIEA